MARKKNTDNVPTVEGTDTTPVNAEETRSALQKVKDDAFAKGAASAEKEIARLRKQLESAEAKLTKLGTVADEGKKEISDLKNFLKAKYKDGYRDGFNKGYNTGTADAKKAILNTIKEA